MLYLARYITALSGILLAAGLIITGLPAQAQTKARKSEKTEKIEDQAYSRRDYRLGITLSEFKAIPYPDQQHWPNAYPVCSDEARANDSPFWDADPPARFKKAGVVGCLFFYNDKAGGRPWGAGLGLDDLRPITRFLFIKADADSEPRLFWIVTEGPAAEYDRVMATFTTAYGKPSSQTNDAVQNRMGAVFQNTTIRWDNSVSYIEAHRYADSIQRFQINHGYKPLMKVFNQRIDQVNAEAAKKL